MRTHIGKLAIEVTRPESAKFHRVLLLVHGLWTGEWIWERWATYLAHRGWESWAPSLVGLGPDRAAALQAVVQALPAAPVIVTHDAGLPAFPRSVVPPAVVAIAPIVGPARGDAMLAWPQFWRARLVGSSVSPPRGSGARLFLGQSSAIRNRLGKDSAAFFRAVVSGAGPLPGLGTPGLVLAGDRDPITSEPAARELATRCGWTHRTIPGHGHFPMLEAGWETVADDVHRWIVRALGADLLAFLDEDSDADPL